MCDCYLWHSVTLSESIPHDVMRFWEGDAMIFIHMWFIGLMERALVFGAEDCRLMAHQDDLICAAGRTMCLANITARLLRACESYTLACACALRLFSIVFSSLLAFQSSVYQMCRHSLSSCASHACAWVRLATPLAQGPLFAVCHPAHCNTDASIAQLVRA